MAEWITTTLEECTDILGDGLHGTPKYTENGEYAFVNGNNLVDGEILIKKETKRVDYSQYDKYKKPLTNRTILVSINGTLGNVGVYGSEKIILGKSACYFNVKESVDKDFIYYIVSSPTFKHYLESNATGTTIKNISLKQMREYTFELPEIGEQKRISSVLRKIDEKIKNNRAINNNLEQQVSILYQSWFEDFEITNGVCPENWICQELSSIADIASGKRPPVKSDICNQETPISIVGAASVMGFTSEANHTDKILITGRVGTHGVIQRFNTPCWTSDNTLVITSSYYEFTNQILRRIDYSSMNRGSTQPLITQGDMKKVVVLIPDENTLANFEELAGSLMAKWEANNKENVKLASLRDTLLPKLMSGELDVSDIEL